MFLADYRVSLAEQIFPAAELSEQISTAGTEASGTGNMKFALNGALTIGTMDGANIEIREEVGDDNIFIFGLTADEVEALQTPLRPVGALPDATRSCARVLDMIRAGAFSPGRPGLFQPIVDSLLAGGDRYLLLADYASYVECQDRVARELPRPGGVDAEVDPERRGHGQVLERPHDPRVRRGDLGDHAGPRGALREGGRP